MSGIYEHMGLITVSQCWNDMEAEVIISFLASHGIKAYPNSEVPHSVLPITIDGLGSILILVEPENKEMATSLLDRFALECNHESDKQNHE